MRSRATALVAAALVCLVPVAAQADLADYTQDFEALVQTAPDALSGDGWVVYGNVFDAAMSWIYGYGVYPAPNDGAGFCQIDLLQGGVDQGLQQLVVFSDYNNADHAAVPTRWIESNLFQEQTVGAADVGSIWTFEFQAKRGNLVSPSTALAFIKTIDPGSGWAMTNFVPINTTAIDTLWNGYSVELAIDAGLVGQYLQFGFSNTATAYESSAIFYDNLVFHKTGDLSSVPVAAGAELRQNFPNPFNPMTRIEFVLEQAGHVDLSVYDVAGRRVATLQSGALGSGEHVVTWNGRTEAGAAAAAGRYEYVLTTSAGRTSRSMVLLK